MPGHASAWPIMGANLEPPRGVYPPPHARGGSFVLLACGEVEVLTARYVVGGVFGVGPADDRQWG